MALSLPLDISGIKGILAQKEGEALYHRAMKVSVKGPCLEFGTYGGKSTVYLGVACQQQQIGGNKLQNSPAIRSNCSFSLTSRPAIGSTP